MNKPSSYWEGKKSAYEDALKCLLDEIALKKGAYDYSTGMVLSKLVHDFRLFIDNCGRLADESELREVHERLAEENRKAAQIINEMPPVLVD